MSISASAFGSLTIDLSAIVNNWRSLRAMLRPGAECGAVVKADAYGMGVAHVAPALADAGCCTFFVASMQEACELITLVPTTSAIYVLGGCLPGDEREFIERQVRPIILSYAMLDRWLVACRSHAAAPMAPRAGLKIDTGMNRYGLRFDELGSLAGGYAQTQIDLILSHLACADTPSDQFNRAQVERFTQVSSDLKARFPYARFSLANSAGIALGKDVHFDLARPGVSLYGARLPSPQLCDIMPVVTLTLPVVHVHHAKPGESIGYGASFRCSRHMTLVTVAGGYADGFLRSMSNCAKGFIDGVAVPLVGRVSMDSLVFDITDLPSKADVKEGAPLEVLGQQQGVDELAAMAGTISYEIMTSLGARYSRAYRT